MRRLALPALALALACFSPGPQVVAVRSIQVRVIDARTKEPLPGIPVAYAVQSVVMRGKFLGLVPSLEPDIGPKLVHKQRGETDPRGVIDLRGEALRLPGNERLEQELLFVNLAVDMTQERSRSMLDALEAGCRSSRVTCGGTPDDVDVAWMLRLSSKPDRNQVFRNPVPAHGGVLVINLGDVFREGWADWTEPGDPFSVRFNFGSLRKHNEAIVVELPPGRP